MISLRSNSGKLLYGIDSYILDTETDIQLLPTNIKPGSTAFVIENLLGLLKDNNIEIPDIEMEEDK